MSNPAAQKLSVEEETEQYWRRKGREGSVSAAEKRAISTVCGAATVHGGLQVWETDTQDRKLNHLEWKTINKRCVVEASHFLTSELLNDDYWMNVLHSFWNCMCGFPFVLYVR